jgi:hypothetical protein
MSAATDYFIAGAGAVGMAFADTLLSETDAQITIVDRYPKPGGHWNVAYPFVTLHQPSAFYGVASRELDDGTKEASGLNAGLSRLASGTEVLAYFERVMHERLLPSGRVRYFPMSEFMGAADGTAQWRNRLSGETLQMSVGRKFVDCTYLQTSVPATHTPSFTVGAGLTFLPVHRLVELREAPPAIVVVGGGKTGIDACLWLLQNGVPAERIFWVMPRDAWWINRATTQPTMEFFDTSLGAVASQMEAIAQSTDIENLFDRLEASGNLLRLDPKVRPTMFHAATVSEAEAQLLRSIPNVIRKGRVRSISPQRIELEFGELAITQGTVVVDCSARAIPSNRMIPVFQGNRITPQTVRPYQPVFSASFIAHIEASVQEESTKNQLCEPVPLPNAHTDWIPMQLAMMRNQSRWAAHPGLREWLVGNRLDGFSRLVAQVAPEDADKRAILKRIREASGPAAQKLVGLLGLVN